MIGLSLEELSTASNLPLSAVAAVETEDAAPASNIVHALKATLEAHGIVFLASGNLDAGGPGIRLKLRDDEDDGIRPENLNSTNDD